MQIDKAIEILTIHNDYIPNFTEAEWQEAHQLGIEALKHIKHGRSCQGNYVDNLLPSEDPE